MTLFWIVLLVAGALSALWIAMPFLRERSVELSGADGAISIYRDQIDEVARDRKDGLISAEEAKAATQEIERRALHAARNLDSGFAMSHRSLTTALVLVVLVAGAALGTYATLGAPEKPDRPLAARQTEMLEQRAAAGDITSRIQLLIARTQENPESFEDWWMLARSHSSVGDNASAVEAYRKAVELGGDRPAVLSAYAEAMTLANGNKVPDAARVIFEQISREAADPRAFYYLALAKAQSQDFTGALQDWTALAQASAPDAPWMAMVRRDIVNMARFLKEDVTLFLPDATEAEIAASGGEAHTAPQVSIAELEDALRAEPKDYKGWIALAEARSRAGDQIGAAAAIGEGKRHYMGAPFVIQKFAEAEQALGLDLLPPSETVRGPDADQIVAAQSLTAEEQADMIDGMVAGLAARLEEQPNNPDGWVMLVRSYATLGRIEKAEAAYATAREVFAAEPALLSRLEAEAGVLLH